MRVTTVVVLIPLIIQASAPVLAQHKPPARRLNAPTVTAAHPVPVPIKYVAGSKPYVSLTWSWREIRYNHTYRCKTPRGTVSVRFLPHRDSKRPPPHELQETIFTDMPVIIRSPRTLPVWVEIGDGPGYVTAAAIRVNGRSANLAHERVWIKGGRHVLQVTYPDAE